MTATDAVLIRNEGTSDTAIGMMKTAILDTDQGGVMTTRTMTVMTGGAAITADTDPLRDRGVELLPAVRAVPRPRIDDVVHRPLALGKGKDHDRHTAPASHVLTGMVDIIRDAHPRHDIASPDGNIENTEKYRTDKTEPATMTPRPDWQPCSKTQRNWTRSALSA